MTQKLQSAFDFIYRGKKRVSDKIDRRRINYARRKKWARVLSAGCPRARCSEMNDDAMQMPDGRKTSRTLRSGVTGKLRGCLMGFAQSIKSFVSHDVSNCIGAGRRRSLTFNLMRFFRAYLLKISTITRILKIRKFVRKLNIWFSPERTTHARQTRYRVKGREFSEPLGAGVGIPAPKVAAS